ncbi:sugar nucleotide-binding protein [Microbulbifer hainanensis]|uniref:sugar nucleotide-binding protein n=1 Tax=Microbulbifer hainanensis TaxID=2735675 RepID=UPI001865FE2B|nr:sugar nucleotide-binding protein [Microbulbifer hainanensis]
MPEHHTGYQPDSVAVIGAGSGIDGALQKRLQRVGFRVQLLGVDQLEELRPGAIVINVSACAGGQAMGEALRVCRELAQKDCCLLHLSSYQVFAGGARKRYDEEDEPAPSSEAGLQWLACEQALVECRTLSILRLGWMIDRNEDALLGRILRGLVARQPISLDDQSRGSPVTVNDLTRVVVAMAQQLASGAPTAGIYHYGASDTCTALEFAREVVERAQSFYDEDLEVQLSALPEEEDASVVLACGKVRDVFGIQQRSWRQGLTRQVELWLERLDNDS